jgi:F0F1-type ATP synthase alpha subunit
MRLTELLKQPQYSPLKLSEQIALIHAGNGGQLRSVANERVPEWKEKYLRFMNTQYSSLLGRIDTEKKWNDEVKGALDAALQAFMSNWS